MVNWGEKPTCPYYDSTSGTCARLKTVVGGNGDAGCDRKTPSRTCPLSSASERRLMEVALRRKSPQKPSP